MKKVLKRIFLVFCVLIVIFVVIVCYLQGYLSLKPYEYKVVSKPTPNVTQGRCNAVRGVVLHHTADVLAGRALDVLTDPKSKVSCHALIDTDGTVYELAPPNAITYHAGHSMLNGLEWCNTFTIGIEFQGNTSLLPLTESQIKSGITYLKPIIRKYNIPLDNIVTHEMVRNNYLKTHPNAKVDTKVDITQKEYNRFMERLNAEI